MMIKNPDVYKNEGFHTAFKKQYKDIYILYSIDDDECDCK